jgi:5'-nucleotidase
VNRMSRLARESVISQTFMQAGTANIIQREWKRSKRLENPKMHWKLAASLVIKSIRSKRHYQDTLSVSQVEHMGDVDCFDGGKIIREWGAPQAQEGKEEKDQGENGSGKDADDLLVIHPVVDGRMKDIGRD